MRKFLLLLFAASVSFAFAQQAERNISAQRRNFTAPTVQQPKKKAVDLNVKPVVQFDVNHNAIVNPLLQKDSKQAPTHKSVRHHIPGLHPTDTVIAKYSRPAGSLYLGLDRIGFGMFNWNYPTLVGSWLNGVDAWTYENTSSSNTDTQLSFTWDTYWNDVAQYYYEAIMEQLDPSDWEDNFDYYHANARIGGKQQIVDGNFVDSIPAQEFSPWGYSYTTLRPVLIASNGVASDTFAINMFYPMGDDLIETTEDPETGEIIPVTTEDPETGETVNVLKTVYDVMLENGSITSGDANPFEFFDANGLWPMTELPAFYLYDEYYNNDGTTTFDPNTYANYSMYMFTSQDRSTWGYVYGSNEQLYYKFNNEGYQGVEAVKPDFITVSFDKPMSPLYVHDIMLPIFAFDDEGYLAIPSFDQINIAITDANFTPLFVTHATLNDTTTSRFGGQMLNFKIQEVDEYGEIMSEGITLTDEFMILITGLTDEGNNVGIVSGYEPDILGVTQIMSSSDENAYYLNDYSPMVILNGNYVTLQSDVNSIENGATDEVVDVEMVLQSDGYYYALMPNPDYPASSQYQYMLPSIYASYIPVDTLANNAITYDISMPDEGYEIDFEIDNDGYVYWNDYHIAYVYIISVDGQFHSGDEIKISKFGRSITYRVSNDPTGLNKVSADGLTSVENLNGEFRLTYTNDFDRVDMINANGQRVAEYQLPKTGEFFINASAMPNGVYMFRMTGKNVNEILRALK